MNEKIQKMIARINQLRAISKSTHSRAEAETTAALAAKLIAEYQISEAQIEAETGKTNDPLDLDGEHIIYETARTTEWKRQLANGIADLNGLFIYNATVRGKESHRKQSRFRIVGKVSAIQVAQYMWSYLVETITSLADDYVPPTNKRGVNPDREQWCLGAVRGFLDKMNAAKKEALKLSTSAAMVLVNNAAQEAEQAFLKKTGIKLRYVTHVSHAQKREDMYASGYKQGQKLNVNPGMGGSNGNNPKLGN
jgi:hypothetical protein